MIHLTFALLLDRNIDRKHDVIEFINRDESLDYNEQMQSLQADLKDLFEQENQLKNEVSNVFKTLGYEL